MLCQCRRCRRLAILDNAPTRSDVALTRRALPCGLHIAGEGSERVMRTVPRIRIYPNASNQLTMGMIRQLRRPQGYHRFNQKEKRSSTSTCFAVPS